MPRRAGFLLNGFCKAILRQPHVLSFMPASRVQARLRDGGSALLLLMLGILADHHDAPFALDNLALFTNGLDRGTNLHAFYLLIRPVSGLWAGLRLRHSFAFGEFRCLAALCAAFLFGLCPACGPASGFGIHSPLANFGTVSPNSCCAT